MINLVFHLLFLAVLGANNEQFFLRAEFLIDAIGVEVELDQFADGRFAQNHGAFFCDFDIDHHAAVRQLVLGSTRTGNPPDKPTSAQLVQRIHISVLRQFGPEFIHCVGRYTWQQSERIVYLRTHFVRC